MTELSRGRRVLVLLICCMSLFIVSLDNTIVNIALPAIGHDLHAPLSGLQWTIDSYTLVLASLLMLSGSTADRIGRRRIFQAGLVLFAIGSLLCSVAPSLGWLVVFRMVQAAGGSMLNPVAMSIITNTFTEPKERARAIGVWGGVSGLSMALGPLVGGLLVDTVGWRGIFLINLPIGVVVIVLTAIFVTESKAPRARRIDPVGQALVIVLLATLCFGIIEGPGTGWTSVPIIACFCLAAAALAGLLIYEPHRDEPLLDLRLFRSAPFSGAAAIAVCSFAALGGFLFLNTLYLQNVRGLTALQAGLYLLPAAVGTMVFAPLSGRMVAARGARTPLVVAGLLTLGSGALLTLVTPTTPTIPLLLVYLAFGSGYGLVNAPITNTAVAGMPRSQAGVAAAVASTSRNIGLALGVAVAGSVMASSLSGSLVTGFARAGQTGWWLLAGYGAVVFALGIITTGRWARGSAERVAARLSDHETRVAVTTP